MEQFVSKLFASMFSCYFVFLFSHPSHINIVFFFNEMFTRAQVVNLKLLNTENEGHFTLSKKCIGQEDFYRYLMNFLSNMQVKFWK